METGGEMVGLWSRPIRPRALQQLLTSVRVSTLLTSALCRLSTFWNLLLDDYQLERAEIAGGSALRPVPQGGATPQRFGHMLILKLAHGLLSWLARHEVQVKGVECAFDRPTFEEDYAPIFHTPIRFGAPATAIHFDAAVLGPVQIRGSGDMDRFLENAPRDWTFTRSQQRTQSLRVRAHLRQVDWGMLTSAGRHRS
ncbi:AraC family transcriptional regulator ligand-binding domain-containing protein [uncultured Roseobacter sp.]|uniref:AraC family transcriptional regulator ligand-binding domain-containing protein n=1 Tax=uncultured Roseobacter sp. TaxID=114847 RepID=UPI00344D0E01